MSETTTVPPLLTSINQLLADLARHAGVHGHEEGAAGEPDDKEDAPECLVDHIVEISNALFTLLTRVNPEIDHNTMLVLPRDLPEGLVEQMQEVARVAAEKTGRS